MPQGVVVLSATGMLCRPHSSGQSTTRAAGVADIVHWCNSAVVATLLYTSAYMSAMYVPCLGSTASYCSASLLGTSIIAGTSNMPWHGLSCHKMIYHTHSINTINARCVLQKICASSHYYRQLAKITTNQPMAACDGQRWCAGRTIHDADAAAGKDGICSSTQMPAPLLQLPAASPSRTTLPGSERVMMCCGCVINGVPATPEL